MPKIVTKMKQIFTSKKAILTLVLFFVAAGVIIPIHIANAAVWWLVPVGIAAVEIAKFALGVVKEAFVVIAGLVAITLIGKIFLILGVSILGLVTSPGFISLSYTNPANNRILELGWSATRNLVNIGFVVVLIIIGLATALRIKEYQWQKTLPRLIAIILLVNFTPVIIGAVVDASNIIMNFFLKNVKEWGNFVTAYEFSGIAGLFKVAKSLLSLEQLGKTIVFWVYCYTTGAILIIYAVLFVLRYVAIWILVILSPLAFFAYILPGTRQYFRMWWRQLLNWCFIGVIAGFFLWLANITLTQKLIPVKGEVPGEVPGGGLFNTLLPYLVVVAFLYIAFFVGLKTSAFGAGAIVSWAQKKGRARIEKVREWAKTKARRAPPRLIGEERWRKIAQRLAGAKGGRISRTITKLLPGVRPIGRGMLGMVEAERRAADEGEAEAKKAGVDAARNLSEIRKEVLFKSFAKAGGRLSGAIDKKQVEELKKLGLTPREIKNIVKGLIEIGDKKRAEKIASSFSSDLIKAKYKPEDLGFDFDRTTPEGQEEAEKYEKHAREHGYYDKGAYWGKLLAEARTAEEIAGFKDLLISEKPEHAWVQEAVHKFWDPTQARRAGEEIGSSFIAKFQDAAKPEWWYLKENRGMHKFLGSTAAQSAGFSFSTPEAEKIRGMSRGQIETELNYIQREFEGMHPGPEKEDLIRKIDTYQRELARKEREEREAAAEERPKEKKPKEKGPRRKHGRIIR